MKTFDCDLRIKDFMVVKEFHGCDGKPWDDKFLQYRLDLAVNEENYEYAAKCRDELKRRNK